MADAMGAETTEARALWAFLASVLWGIRGQVIKRS
jgi:hypothetical protein